MGAWQAGYTVSQPMRSLSGAALHVRDTHDFLVQAPECTHVIIYLKDRGLI